MEPIRQIIRETIALAGRIYLHEDYDDTPTPDYLYYGTGARHAFAIKNSGMMNRGQGKRAINFIGDIQSAKYFAFMKNGRRKGIVLRTKFSHDKFEPSKRYPLSWRILVDIPASDLEVLDGNNWVPLEQFDPYITFRQ